MSDTGDSVSKEKAIQSVTRRVMWGEPDAQILDSLKLQGYPEELALGLLHTAHRDRVRTIRRIYRPKIWWGLLLIGLGLGVVWGFHFLTSGYPGRSAGQIFIQLAPFVYGAWQFLNGLTGILTAGSRTGPVSEIE